MGVHLGSLKEPIKPLTKKGGAIFSRKVLLLMLTAKVLTADLIHAYNKKGGALLQAVCKTRSNVREASSEFLQILDEAHARIQKLEESYERYAHEAVSGYGASHGSLKRYKMNRVRRGSSVDREYPYTEFDVVFQYAISPLEDKDPELFHELSEMVSQSTDIFRTFYLYRYADIKRLCVSLERRLVARLEDAQAE